MPSRRGASTRWHKTCRTELYDKLASLPLGAVLRWPVNNNMDAVSARSCVSSTFPGQFKTVYQQEISELWIWRIKDTPVPKPEEIFKLECTILHSTDRALLIQEPGGETIWIPKSQCFDLDELPDPLPRGFETELKISAWIAKEKGLR